MKVQEVMTSPVRTVGTDTTLKDVARLLGEHSISGLPVVDASGALLGIVSKADILLKETGGTGAAGERGGLLSLLRDGGDPPLARKVEARTAGEAMTSPAISIEPDRSIAAAAALMLESRINRIPVVSRDGTLVGIVSRSDLVRAFTRSDADIEGEIREDVLMGVFWLVPTAIEIEVEKGEVTLRGELEMRTDAEMIPKFVRKVFGVVGVESQLTWRIDGRAEFERRGA